MLLSRHFRRKFLATVLTAGVFMLLYEATVIDSRSMADPSEAAVGPPARGVRTAFEATAYCRGTTTASGVAVRAGIAASDPKMLPTGSVIQVQLATGRVLSVPGGPPPGAELPPGAGALPPGAGTSAPPLR